MGSTTEANLHSVRQDFAGRRREFEEATRGLTFTKDFNASIEALMHDRMESMSSRVLAWIKRRAWGSQCLYCIKEDGSPAYQVDCAAELQIDKRRVSSTVLYLVRGGYVELRGSSKIMYPVVSPVPAEKQTKSERKSSTYRTFLQIWKVQHVEDFAEYEVHVAAVKSFQKVLFGAYREWRTALTAIRNKEGLEDIKKEGAPPPPPISQVNGHVVEEDEEPQFQKDPEPEASAIAVVETLPAVIERPVDPVPTFEQFRHVYPGEVDPNSEPEFIKLKAADKIACVSALPRFIRCGQWQDPQFIPRASNFILRKTWKFDAPPGRGKKAQERSDLEQSVNMIRAMRARHGQ